MFRFVFCIQAKFLPISSSSEVMDLDLSAIAGVLSLLLCWGTGGGRGEAVSQAQDSPRAAPQGALNSALLFFLEPSSMSGLRVTMTTLTMRLLPPCRIMLTTCLWPTFTTFCPLTWNDDDSWEFAAKYDENWDCGAHFYQEISHPEASSPGNATLIHWLQVLQGGEGRGGGELLDGGLSWRHHKQPQKKTSHG